MSRKTGDTAVLHVNGHGRRLLGEPRHTHDGPRHGHHETRTGVENQTLDRKRKALRSAKRLRVVSERERGLGDADRQFAKAELFNALEILERSRSKLHAVAAVGLRDNSVEFVNDGRIGLVCVH